MPNAVMRMRQVRLGGREWGAGGVGVAWVVGQERVRGVELRVG